MPKKPAPSTTAAELREFVAQPEHRPMMTELYRRAEAELRKRRKNQTSKAAVAESQADPQRLLHELQVHQIELEMQNTELRHARDHLEVTLENYTDLYDFAPAGYFTLTDDGRIQQTNLTGAHLVGSERAQLVNQPFARLVSPKERPAFYAFLNQVFSDQTKRTGDFELALPGGPLVAVNIEAQRLPNGLECRAVVMDITDRKQAEQHQRRTLEFSEAIMTNMGEGLYTVDAQGLVTYLNPAAEKLFGWSLEELRGSNLHDLTHHHYPDGRPFPATECAGMQVVRHGVKLTRQEDFFIRKDGTFFDVVYSASPLRTDGLISGVVVVFRDITERKQAEQAVRVSEERYRTLFDLGPVAIYCCAVSGMIEQFNRRAQELWGRAPEIRNPKERFCGSFKLFHPDGRALRHAKCPMAQVLKGQLAEVRDQEVIVERPDASRLTCLVNILPLKNERGEITGAINCFYDITERKNAEAVQRRFELLTASNLKLEKEIIRRRAVEESLRQSEQQKSLLLEQSRQMQGQLRQLSHQTLQAQEEERKRISRELHDVIAQTLTGINLRLTALKTAGLTDRPHLPAEIARTQRLVEKSVQIVHQFARTLRPNALDDLGLIPALNSFVEDFAKQARLRVRLKVFAGVEQLSGPKRTVLYRVAQEALTNVARHARATQVKIGIEKGTNEVHLRIKDNGKSFAVQRTLDAKKNRRLGLLGMRERVEMVGGRFSVESAPGQGTTIQVQIPLDSVRGGDALGKKAKTQKNYSESAPAVLR